MILPLLLIIFSSNEKRFIDHGDLSQHFFKDSLFDMCSVMPGDEVASLSPFGKPIKKVTPDDRLDGYCGCHYDLQSDDDFPQVSISVNQFASIKESRSSYDMYRKDWVDLYGRQPDEVAGVGDAACFLGNAEPGKCDDCNLHVISGRYFIAVKFKGYYDKVTQQEKINSGISIVKKLFEKKPYLGK